MLDIWHHREFLQGITSAIYEHAATVTDERMFWVGVASVAVSLFAIIFTVFTFYQQKKLIEQQNKIALFEKRYKIVLLVDEFTVHLNSLDGYLNKIKNKTNFIGTTEILSMLFCKSNADPLSDARLSYCEFTENTINSANELIVALHRMEFLFELTSSDKSEINHIKEMIKYFLQPIHDKKQTIETSYVYEKLTKHFKEYPSSLLLKNLNKQLYFTKRRQK